jgi:hypothetical protein
LVVLCSPLAARSPHWEPDSVAATVSSRVALAIAPKPTRSDALPLHLEIALRYEGLEERPGNRGEMIDRWNLFVGNPRGSAYCAAYISWCLAQALVEWPTLRTGWARNFFTPKSYTMNDVLWGRYTPKPGDIIPFTRPGGGHVGFVTRYFGKGKFELVEANTSPGSSGSQHNGGGVYRRTRTYQPHASFRMMGVTPVLE